MIRDKFRPPRTGVLVWARQDSKLLSYNPPFAAPLLFATPLVRARQKRIPLSCNPSLATPRPPHAPRKGAAKTRIPVIQYSFCRAPTNASLCKGITFCRAPTAPLN